MTDEVRLPVRCLWCGWLDEHPNMMDKVGNKARFFCWRCGKKWWQYITIQPVRYVDGPPTGELLE